MTNNETPTPEALREERLKEVAEKLYRTDDVFNDRAIRISEIKQQAFIAGAKSDAAKQYHSSEPVDLDDLECKIFTLIPHKVKDNNHANYIVKTIIDAVKPYLQPSQQDEIDRLKQ